MVLSEQVRMTENIRLRQEEVFTAIRAGEPCKYLYCITLPSNPCNLLDIHPYRELHKRKVYDEPYIILGLAENRGEAVGIIYDMVSEVAASLSKLEDFKETFLKYRDSLVPLEQGERDRR